MYTGHEAAFLVGFQNHGSLYRVDMDGSFHDLYDAPSPRRLSVIPAPDGKSVIAVDMTLSFDNNSAAEAIVRVPLDGGPKSVLYSQTSGRPLGLIYASTQGVLLAAYPTPQFQTTDIDFLPLTASATPNVVLR